MNKLSLPNMSPERMLLLVTVKVAYRALKRHYAGDDEALQNLNGQAARWLEERDYIQAVLREEERRFVPTQKAERAILS